MEKKFWKTAEFKSVQREWEQKLQQENFPDIEKTVGFERVLKQFASNFNRYFKDQFFVEQRRNYSRIVSECLHSKSFDKEVDRAIWELKAEGKSIREICDALSSRGLSRNRDTVRFTIRKYEHRWGIKNWEPEKLDLNFRKRAHIKF